MRHEISLLYTRYSLANISIILIYIIFRFKVLNPISLRKPDITGFSTEITVLVISSAVVFLRFRKYYSFLHFLSTFFMYSKITTLVFAFIARNYFLILLVSALSLIIFLMIGLPNYKGPSYIIELTEEELENILGNEETEENYIFCLFYSSFSESCFLVSLLDRQNMGRLLDQVSPRRLPFLQRFIKK